MGIFLLGASAANAGSAADFGQFSQFKALCRVSRVCYRAGVALDEKRDRVTPDNRDCVGSRAKEKRRDVITNPARLNRTALAVLSRQPARIGKRRLIGTLLREAMCCDGCWLQTETEFHDAKSL